MDYYYHRAKDIASRVVDNEAVLVSLTKNELLVLNLSASRIWVSADGISRGVELGKGLDKQSVKLFLDEMVSRGLFKRTNTPADVPDLFPQDVAALFIKVDDEAPVIRVCEQIEVLAGVCDSALSGFSDCRTTTCLVQVV